MPAPGIFYGCTETVCRRPVCLNDSPKNPAPRLKSGVLACDTRSLTGCYGPESFMFKVIFHGRSARSDVGEYAYFVLSTGTYQTYARWRAGGRPNPFRKKCYGTDIVTRTQIVELFSLDRS